MPVDVLTSLEAFDATRAALDEVYAADCEANLFCAPWWLRAWLEITPLEWAVLVYRPETAAAPVAYLPIGLRSVAARGVALRRELLLGAKPYGALSSFACRPEHSEQALPVLGRALHADFEWDVLRIDELLDPRLPLLLRDLPGDLQHERDEPLVCPVLDLGADWDSHLATAMSKKGRFNLRRSLRQLAELPGYRVSAATPETFESHLADLLTLWAHRWGPMPPNEVAYTRHMYGASLRREAFWLRVVHAEERPIAALAAFDDDVRGSVLYYTSGFHPDYARLSPGSAIVGLAIRDAIAAGRRSFDFLVGGHDYKLSFFGARARSAARARVLRRSLRGTVGAALLRARDLVRRVRGASPS